MLLLKLLLLKLLLLLLFKLLKYLGEGKLFKLELERY